jgi:uncharacterized membrane protein
MLQAARTVDGRALWANLHLLFWLSLFPFGTAWMGEHDFAPIPVATYGVLMLVAALAYYGLARALMAVPGQPRTLADAIGRDVKGKVSPVLFAIAIPAALVAPAVSMAIYAGVVVMWLVPDRRIERAIRE